jgi:hypothetical protein
MPANRANRAFSRSAFLTLLTAAIFVPLSLSATIFTVDAEHPADFADIPSAIAAAANGDEIMVYPGTYAGPVDYLGKSLRVYSLAIVTGDTTYVSQTILDGQWQSGVVKLVDCAEAYLGGFTIQHGIGFTHPQGYHGLYGGGLMIFQGNATIERCHITENYALDGGGIYSIDATTRLIGNITNWNSAASDGGGIAFGRSDQAPDDLQNEQPVSFSTVDKNSVYCNMAGFTANDISITRCPYYHIELKKFTIGQEDIPSSGTYYIESWVGYNESGSFFLSVEEAAVSLASCDLYVSSDGGNGNSGLSPDNPLRSISLAMMRLRPDSTSMHTIHVASGVYSPSRTGELLPVHYKLYTSIVGGEQTVIDGDEKFTFSTRRNSYDVVLQPFGHVEMHNLHFTHGLPYASSLVEFEGVENVVVENVRIDETATPTLPDTPQSAALASDDCSYTIFRDIDIESYWSSDLAIGFALAASAERVNDTIGTGLFMIYDQWFVPSVITLSNCCSHGNSLTTPWPGAARVSGLVAQGAYDEADPDSCVLRVVNCTIAGNNSLNGAVLLADRLHAEFYNTIVANNNPDTIVLDGRNNNGSAYFSHCLFGNGTDDIQEWGTGYEWSSDAILAGDPLFLGGGEYPYQLTQNSPCIDTGTTDIPGYQFPETDLAGNPRLHGTTVDIGAYEYHPSDTGDQVQPASLRVVCRPNPVVLHQRPSEYCCTLSFDMPKSGTVGVGIFNLRGQRVRSLASGSMPRGHCDMRWDGRDDSGRAVGSGVYLYRVECGSEHTEGKLTLMK